MQYIEESQDICHAAVESEGQLTWASIAPLCFCSENTFHFVGKLQVQESQKKGHSTRRHDKCKTSNSLGGN